MNRVIWKYAINPATTVEMPEGGKVLTLQVQDNQPTIWALVDPAQPKVRRYFFSVPTGEMYDYPPGAVYIGTFQLQGGALVFHVFEDIAPVERRNDAGT